ASVHFDARLPGAGADIADLVFEIQLRTLCQHVWAEMSHTIAYKSDWEPPVALSRELNCLSALLELADTHFQLVWDGLNSLPEGVPYKILTVLEKHFLGMAPRRYDPVLSLQVIAHLIPVLDRIGSHKAVIAALDCFCLSEREALAHVLSTYADRNVFLGQPEAILVFFLLGREKFHLRDLWQQRFPVEDLEELAGLWSMPYSE
ncbi:MAG TPA: hypothetical protein GX513_03810, partial [Firmicutes bacterium]|nr:hypothetical protein [Bacillota bacterium]